MISAEQRPAWFEYLNQMLGSNHVPGPTCKCIASLRGEDLAAVVVFSAITPVNCVLSIASDGRRAWSTPAFYRAIFGYVFSQLQLKRCTVLIEQDNEPAVQLCAWLGFHIEGIMRDAGRSGQSVILMGMLRQDCRWIGGQR